MGSGSRVRASVELGALRRALLPMGAAGKNSDRPRPGSDATTDPAVVDDTGHKAGREKSEENRDFP